MTSWLIFRLSSLLLVGVLVLDACRTTPIKEEQNESPEVIDQLISMKVDTIKSEVIEKRIVNDTLVFIRYVKNKLYDKKQVLPNQHTITTNYDGKVKAGSKYELNEHGRFVQFEFWSEGKCAFYCEYGESGEIIKVDGSSFLTSINNAEGLRKGDTLWVNTYMVPVPNSRYVSCRKKVSDSEFWCSYNYRTNGLKPIVQYFALESDDAFTTEHVFYLEDSSTNRKMDSCRFTIDVLPLGRVCNASA